MSRLNLIKIAQSAITSKSIHYTLPTFRRYRSSTLTSDDSSATLVQLTIDHAAMQTSNLWSSLKTTLFIQRIYCLSPFYLRDNGKLQAPWPALAYNYAYLTIYIAIILISIFNLNILVHLREFLPAGFMWIALSGFEFFFTIVTFVLVVVCMTIKRGGQMEFLRRVAKVDARLQRHFGAQVHFGRLQRYNRFAWIGMSLYYHGLAVVMTIVVCRTNLSRLVPLIFAHQMEEATASGLAFLLVNYMLILRARFVLVRRIYDATWQEYFYASNRRQKDAVLRRLTVVFQAFKELSDLVAVFDRAFGLVALIRLAHDFTLLNTQLYLVFWLARDARTISDLGFIGVALVWMLPSVIKIGCTTVSVESTLDAV